MAVDPLGDLSSLVSQYAAEDFLAQRKRLREARMRWIDENECPTAYVVKTTQPNGEETAFQTPFQIGKIQYPDQYNEEWKEKGQTHEDPQAENQLLEGLDGIISQSSTEKRLTVLVAGDEQHAFITGGSEPESPHPAIEEGESYGDYYARVASQYEREASKFGRNTRGSIACNDPLRQSAAVDSPGGGRLDATGGSASAGPGPVLGRDTDEVCPGDESTAAGTEPSSDLPNRSAYPNRGAAAT